MKRYSPSSGTEGVWFMGKFCDHCIKQHPDPDSPTQCEILMHSMCYSVDHKDFPVEWIYDERDNPTCTAWVKWDWGRDDDGNFKEPSPSPIDDPNQLVMPFLFDELVIKRHENTPSHIKEEMV